MNKLIASLLLIIMMVNISLASSVGSTGLAATRASGDVNGDGKLNSRDILSILEYLTGDTTKDFYKTEADFNGDGSVNVKDVIEIMRYIIKTLIDNEVPLQTDTSELTDTSEQSTDTDQNDDTEAETSNVSDDSEEEPVKLNAVKNFQKLLNLNYTTAMEIPQGINNANPIKSGTIFNGSGIIYSSTKHIMGYVGNCISLYTYLSAVTHPRSCMSVNISDPLNNPVPNPYGIQFAETNGSAYYGTVCSASAAYTINIPIWSTWYWDCIPGMEKLELQEPSEIQPGDMICKKHEHVVFVYDVIRDDNDNVTQICTYEAAGKAINRRIRSPEEMVNNYHFGDLVGNSTEAYNIYRYRYINDVWYERDPYVTVGRDLRDEDLVAAAQELKLIPRKGDKCNYLESESVILDYYGDDPSNDTIVVYKNGEPISPEPLEISDGSVELGNMEYGSYRAAILSDGEETNDCFWIVVDAVSDATASADGVIVGYRCSNAIPMFVYWEGERTKNGTEAAVVYTDFIQGAPNVPPGFKTIIPRGAITIGDAAYPESVITTLPFKDAYRGTQNNYYRYRVAFKTEYGIVFSTVSQTIAESEVVDDPAAGVPGRTITLSSSWIAGDDEYTQEITIPGVTANSRIDLCYDTATINQMAADGVIALFVRNENGVLYAVCVGNALTKEVTIQYAITEMRDSAKSGGSSSIVGKAIRLFSLPAKKAASLAAVTDVYAGMSFIHLSTAIFAATK